MIDSMGPQPRRIVLELDPGAPINGRLYAEPNLPRPFTGWLSLLVQLQTALGADAATEPAPPLLD
jgi:hypothetical protein